MKKNWLQIVTLCLCVILLAITINQGRKLENYHNQLENEIDYLRQSVESDIESITNSFQYELEEANRSVSEYALEPVGIDKENRALLANVSVSLKEWYGDTAMVLNVTVSDRQVSLPMITDGSGTFIGHLSLPLEENCEVYLDVLISGGDLTKKEALGGWSEISMLLPLRNSGGGWTGPTYQDGVMRSRFDISIEGQNGKPGPINDPVFRTYKNGELVQTLTAVIDPYSSASNGVCYTVDTEDNVWSIECSPDDVIEIHFCCEDEYGLGYDFLFQQWTSEGTILENQTGAGVQYGTGLFDLYWPE